MRGQRTLKARDTIFGAMGRAYVTINGNREELMYVKNIEAFIEKNKIEVPVLGQTGTKHKAGGWNGTGSMTIYYCTSLFRKMMLEYVKTGVDTYFEMVLENDDPSSSIGKQTILLKGCNIDSVVISKLDVESEAMDEEVEFTFEDVDMLEEFRPLVGE